MEEKLQNLYQEIAETVNNMIPEEWEKFYFYAQISEDGGGTYFFYNQPEDKKTYHYSLEITERFAVSEMKFNEQEDKLFDLSSELREVFDEYNQDLWYSFTMSLDSEGNFSVSFDYTNWFNTDYGFLEQLKIWKFKYLREIPTDEKTKNLIDQYLKEYPSNPI
ncbi:MULTISPECIES: immunity protein YezG family protein [Priestia]|uniref:immunity protein YezG family protein n=1 Tax=Priestia TaxID=2800373 RepID=UPI00048F31F6|nr:MULTISPECIES: immunity protein YezG family protein [Priestia]KNH10460.1 cytoplasmic protein [Priestia megaterium]MED3960826.1 DUF600 family protein [Priestia aryabhattai]MED3991078.1 DUF600 family protein [Priestia aryabhattai]MED3999132.1 DUF600 family protein [Priestia aryabhattai]MED4007925.1 DUF600 family protein [Priestia aryabhattai]